MKPAARLLWKVCASRTNYWLSFAFDITTTSTLVFLGIRHAGDWHWLNALTCFITGAFVFTFIEYGMHRWLFHARASFATASHHTHHVAPREPTAMPFPCGIAAGVLLYFLFSPAMGETAAYLVAGGIISAYTCYGVLHHLQHHVNAANVPFQWMKTRWAAHAIHHGYPDKNYGVTTSLWDRVFGTYRAQRSVIVRQRVLSRRLRDSL